MTRREMQLVESVQDGWHVGYAYLYPVDGREKRAFVFDMVPENIASFIYRNQYEARKIQFTDMLNRLLFQIDTNGDSTCESKEFCQKIADSLQAIMDGSEPAEFAIVSKSLYDLWSEQRGVILGDTAIMVLLRKE